MGRAAWFACAALAVMLAIPQGALGGTWPLLESGSAILSFGDTYQRADGSSVRHSGLDIAAQPGSRVLSVSDGVVTFVGSVPSGSGSTYVAVSVQSSSGHKWSYLPLEGTVVTPGDVLAEGQHLGYLAARGDASAPEPHLHLGLRESDVYLDPSSLLCAPVLPNYSDPVTDEPSPKDLAQPAAPVAAQPQVPISQPAATAFAPAPLAEPALPQGSVSAVQPAVTVTTEGNGEARVHRALIRDADVPRIVSTALPSAPLVALGVAPDPPSQQALRFAPALIAAAGLFIGYSKRPKSSCVTAPGETVAAAQSR